jgi:hypothetical protein
MKKGEKSFRQKRIFTSKIFFLLIVQQKREKLEAPLRRGHLWLRGL